MHTSGKKWANTHRFPPGHQRHMRSTFCCCGTPLLLDCGRLYVRVCAYLCVSVYYVYMWSQNMCRLDVPFLPLNLSPAGQGGGLGKRDPRKDYTIICSGGGHVELACGVSESTVK